MGVGTSISLAVSCGGELDGTNPSSSSVRVGAEKYASPSTTSSAFNVRGMGISVVGVSANGGADDRMLDSGPYPGRSGKWYI